MIVTVSDASPETSSGTLWRRLLKWKHLLNDVADQTWTVLGRIERVEFKAWFPYDRSSDCFHMSLNDRGQIADVCE